jgi:RNA polymerase sigma factor (sigma-70 family)
MPLDPVSEEHFRKWQEQRGEAFYAAVHRRWGERGLDALQECLTKICRGRATTTGPFQSVGYIGNWLWQCVEWEVVNIIRNEKIRRRAEQRHAATTATTEVRLGMRVNPAFSECREQLPDNDKEILHLRYVEGLSYEEIADRTGEQAGTVRVRHHRALRRLRECLDSKGLGYDEILDVMVDRLVYERPPSTEVTQ